MVRISRITLLREREAESFPQSRKASQWQKQNAGPGSLESGSSLLLRLAQRALPGPRPLGEAKPSVGEASLPAGWVAGMTAAASWGVEMRGC